MLPLLDVQSEFSPAGTLFVLALMFLPLLFAWATSVYENRLSVYFSEQVGEPVNLSKRQLIFSVLLSYCMPLVAISFGLLGLYQVTGEIWGTEVVDGRPVHSSEKMLTFLAFTLVASWLGTWLAKHLLFRKHLTVGDYTESRVLFFRWVLRVNMVCASLTIALYWLALWLFPDLALKTLN